MYEKKEVMPFMMEFLYFPEDKTEYIPAVLSLILFVALAAIAMYFFVKVSKKQEKQADEQVRKIKEQQNKEQSNVPGE
ncbi:hypothetical protein ACFQ2J_15140 [Thalassobacillus hwangdonensis]|uniref:Uncharacterized protein n=2 Tax=Thalassobacillus hwangdonensis TaxID=546108 RepID=A0ABW3L428_9BACI